MIHDLTMNLHQHISEQIHDHNIRDFFYFVCEIIVLVLIEIQFYYGLV